MKTRLLPFQSEKANEIVRKVLTAQNIIREDASQTQAVLLSSPTGSGKTVMSIAALEVLVAGDEERLPNPNTTIVWLSDSPELNEQSKQKFAATSEVFVSGKLETVESSFDRRVFDPGKIYFINTQKFAVSGTLSRGSVDARRYSIWQTFSNTIEERKGDFVLVIDEAHKGLVAHGTAGERNEARTIPQKFLLGSPGQIPPVPLVIGISATPKRFTELLDRGDRAAHRVVVDPEFVRRSGLLKHRLLIHNPSSRDKHADDTLLREAARQHSRMKVAWARYCGQHDEPLVRPLLVIQVEDGDTGRGLFSRTDIDRLIRSVREELPGLDPASICHCFQEESSVKADGIRIRRVDPSKLQDDDGLFPAEVVLFKTALTTGWDCPRAETMMSFRTARDATMIEQLIGRMVRAPLARSVEDDDLLNTVRMYLPGFDRSAVQNIIAKLSDPSSEEGVPADADLAENYELYERAPSAAVVFSKFSSLPTWIVSRTNNQPALVRLLKLANRLAVTTRIDTAASENIVAEVVRRLSEEVLQKEHEPTFVAAVSQADEIRLESHVFDLFDNRYRTMDRETISASDESIDEVFRACSRSLTGDEAVGLAFWRNRGSTESRRSKLEFISIATDPGVRARLMQWAGQRFDALYQEHAAAIIALPAGKRTEFERLAGGQEEPLQSVFSFKQNIEVKKGTADHLHHIYAKTDGSFFPHPVLNGWESRVLQVEEQRSGFIGWFRNPALGEDRVAVPYRDAKGTWRSKSPDFLVFHGDDSGTVTCALLEPHDIGNHESYLIAKGLADFAGKFSQVFTRVELTIENSGSLKRLDVAKPNVRKEVLALNSNDALTRLFERIA